MFLNATKMKMCNHVVIKFMNEALNLLTESKLQGG